MGLAIAAVFAMVCVGALTLVVMTTRACDGWFGGGAVVAHSPEPFPGADAALVPLGSRDCFTTGGPVMGAAGSSIGVAEVASELRRRGYVAVEDDWTDPTPLPHGFSTRGLVGGCGVAVFVAEPGAWIDAAGSASGAEAVPCTPTVATAAACGDGVVHVRGTGSVWARTFVCPGLTQRGVEESGVGAHVALAHAEAEVSLRTVGWLPEPEVVRQAVPGGSPNSSHTSTPPAAPASGCVAWVAVGESIGRSQTEWDGRALDFDSAQGSFTAGLVSCAPDPSGAPTQTQIAFHDAAGDGGAIWWRPYAPQAGPTVPTRAFDQPVTAADVRIVEPAALRLPATVPRSAPTDHAAPP